MHLYIYTDGAAKGNPGPAGAGAFVSIKNVKDWRFKKFLGITTNNQAEYQAMFFALEKARELIDQNNLVINKIICYSDSELLIKQLKREYKVKNKELGRLFVKIYNLSQNLPPIRFQHILRDMNKKADRLANQAIEDAQK